jgi:hypothetical protein
MNDNEHPDDSTLTRELRDALSDLAAPERPPLAAITTRGRAHQRRRLAGFAGLGGAAAAAGTALALGLTGVLGAAPARSTGTIRTAAPARGTGTIRTAAFALTRNANGTDTLTLTHSQMFDPAALQRALAQHGIPALVKAGTYCWSSPAAPDPASIGVLSLRTPIKLPPPRAGAVRVPSDLNPRRRNWLVDHTVTVINRAAMPAGTKLFFSYVNSGHAVFFDLIYTSSYTCNNDPQPPANP